MTGQPHRTQFTPAFLDDVRARTPLPALIGREVRLTRKGGILTGLCPFHGERRPSFAVYPDHYHCFSCGVHGDAFRYLMDRRGIGFPEAVTELAVDAGLIAPSGTTEDRRPLRPVVPPEPDARPRNHAGAQAMWLAARPSILDTPVENYLKNRHIDLRSLGRAPRALRYHPELWHGATGQRLPAMLAAITDGEGNHVATHRTWLEFAGGGWIKARFADNKMVLGTFAGGSIRLWRGASNKSLKDAPAGDPVVICEGIEDGLSIATAMPEIRVLAAISQGNLGVVDLPPQIGVVILALDNDTKPAAQLAAARIVNRWLDRGFNVRIARSQIGKDFNDALGG